MLSYRTFQGRKRDNILREKNVYTTSKQFKINRALRIGSIDCS